MGRSIEAYGLRIGIRVSDPTVLERLETRFPFGWKRASHAKVDRLYSIDLRVNAPGARVRRYSLLHADSTQLSRTMDHEELLDALETDMRMHVAENAPRRIFVHAGVVGWRGRAIVVPGRSYSGKTTLVREMIRRGATYYSDEYAVLDAMGRVHPFAQPLSIRDHEAKQIKHPVEALGGVEGTRALPVGLVVICRWNGKKWHPRKLSPGVGTLEIVAHTVSARRHPARAIETIRMVVMRAPVIQSSRSEAREAAARILDYADAVAGTS